MFCGAGSRLDVFFAYSFAEPQDRLAGCGGTPYNTRMENNITTTSIEQDPPAVSPEDIKYMKAALKQAEKAIAIGEVPIGAVIVCDGKIIARGYNRRNTDKTTLAHAEIACIRKACKKTGDWRLEGCTLYCTLEPCQMCAGAIVQSRIDRVVIGTTSPKSGCGGTLLNILQNPDFNHQSEVVYDVLRPECTEILQRFFKELRRRNKEEKKRLRMQAAAVDAHDPLQ